MLRSKLKEKDAKGYAKRKALRLSDGAAGDAARSKLKEMNAKGNAKGNAKAKERARANAEARMLANPSMAVQIQTVQEISSQAALVLARTNILGGADGQQECHPTGCREESLQNSLQHHDLGIRLWRHAGMGSKEDKVLKEGQVWYVSIRTTP